MTLQTWKDEFYPIDVYTVSKENAVAHSLQKWIGLRQENLDRHGVRFNKTLLGVEIEDGREVLGIDWRSCALCVHHFRPFRLETRCFSCPLFNVLGSECDDGDDSPFRVFCDTLDPDPMIEALSEILDEEA